MSLEQLEQQIQQLPPSDIVRLAEWFNGFLASRTPAGSPAEPERVADLDRRIVDFTVDPGIAVTFEPDYFEKLKRRIADKRAQKAPARSSGH